MFLPAEIITVMAHFAPAFTQPSYQKVIALLTGTILAQIARWQRSQRPVQLFAVFKRGAAD